MNRKEILESYEVDKCGRIVSPGKFEGEFIFLPAFYEVFIEGCAEDDEDGVLSVPVTDEDREEFPELADRKYVEFIVRDDGLVCEV